jgi:hypothetical protein
VRIAEEFMPRLLGNGPLEITSGGIQYLVPLTALSVDNSGQVQVTSWPSLSKLSSDDQRALRALAQAQFDAGMLSPDTAAPPQAAVVVQAVEKGTVGNDIQVAFSNPVRDPTNPANTTFDTTVTETDVYPLLSIDNKSPNFVGTVLGTGSTTPPSQPGLVRVKAMGTSTQAPAPANYSLDPSTGAGVDVKDAKSNVVFTLEARRTRGSATPAILVQVGAGADDKTFTLTASISLKKNVKPADLLTATDFQDFVTFAAPPGATAVGVPAPGSMQLTGGTPAADAVAAQATIPAATA